MCIRDNRGPDGPRRAVDAGELRAFVDQSVVGISSTKGLGGRMSDMTELAEPVETGNRMRDEIRSISNRARARRHVRSRIMFALCAVALLVTAVPLVLLLFQLFNRGLPVVLHTAFYTQLPQTPTLITPNATGGVSNAILGTLVLTLYASVMAIPVGVLVGVWGSCV